MIDMHSIWPGLVGAGHARRSPAGSSAVLGALISPVGPVACSTGALAPTGTVAAAATDDAAAPSAPSAVTVATTTACLTSGTVRTDPPDAVHAKNVDCIYIRARSSKTLISALNNQLPGLPNGSRSGSALGSQRPTARLLAQSPRTGQYSRCRTRILSRQRDRSRRADWPALRGAIGSS